VGQYGLGITAGINNRNMARAAIQANTNLRYGIELGQNNNIQTQIVTFNHTIVFPRLVPRFGFIKENRRDNFRTILNMGINNTDRFKFFNLYAVNFSWGYQYTWRNKQLNVQLPNFEYTILNKRDSLLKLEERNASYKYIFNDGLISSIAANYTVSGGSKNISNQKRVNFEASGLLSGMFKSKFLDSNLYRFVRVDAEFRQTHKLGKAAFAWRVFGGAGIGLPRFSADSLNRYLPFFRQYIAGGPNSMRAWRLRKLGPGSSNKSTANDVAPERFGDMQLEANAEYRFPLAAIGGMQFNGALFSDIGNIWFLRNNPDFENGAFQMKRLFRDLAIASGLGLRLDFGFILARLDYAYKVKDPAQADGKTWLYDWKPFGGVLQFGINYPF
jgi:outer membrane protein assembly factor BamA